MKKIIALHWFIILLIIVYVIQFLGNTYLTIFTPEFMDFSDSFYDKFILGYYTQFVALGFSVITFVALFFVQKALLITIKKGFFNKDSAAKFKVAGKLFLVSGILSMLWDFILLVYSKGEPYFITALSSDFLLLLIGFGLLIVADYINNGNTIQQENELTI
ncbi:DUF2975 domain-containing protein [Lacinutrix sp. Hel_I_90]|uniref:DUF2975 domain-containing protein n=1 Tax=Lacinutrix sp. Hel_I_90 TaxID=1249999 RepID=UPI0009E39677|nr:DUF2975 domain-containing protein [Lacinutrix sp. Hel_I_90]